MQLPRPSGLITLLTDFGASDPYVGLVKGMALRAHPRAVLVDLCHEVPAQDVALGAFFLRSAVGRFPPGTVHLAVVDPGVGTDRRALCACAHEAYWVGPDNGLLGEVLAPDVAAEVRAVDPAQLGLQGLSRTFHARDLFAPLAGWLAGGRYGFHALGQRIADPVRLPPLLAGTPRVVHVDRFGNLITNLPARALGPGQELAVAGRRARRVGSYGEAGPGQLVALCNAFELVEVAVRNGSAARLLGVGCGEPVAVASAMPG